MHKLINLRQPEKRGKNKALIKPSKLMNFHQSMHFYGFEKKYIFLKEKKSPSKAIVIKVNQ